MGSLANSMAWHGWKPLKNPRNSWELSELSGSVSKPCTPVVHIKIAGKWMFIPLKMILIGIDPYPSMRIDLTYIIYHIYIYIYITMSYGYSF